VQAKTQTVWRSIPLKKWWRFWIEEVVSPIKNSAVTSKKPTSEPFWAVSEQTTSESSQDTIFGNLAELWVGEHCVD